MLATRFAFYDKHLHAFTVPAVGEQFEAEYYRDDIIS